MRKGKHEWITKEILFTVKAYPNPSFSYREASCVAGITRNGEWIRLYPVRIRSLGYDKRPKKYEIVRIRICKYKRDIRPESYLPDEGSYEKIGYLDTKYNWKKRKEWVLPLASKSMCEVQQLQKETYKSLGIFRPKKVIDLIIEDAPAEWTDRQVEVMSQTELFDPPKSLLEKIPFIFKYHYFCEDKSCRGQIQTIVDWEICELYRNLRDKYGDDIKVIRKDIRNKFFNELCSNDKDTYFFVGDMHWHPGSFIVLGVFWPKKEIIQQLPF